LVVFERFKVHIYHVIMHERM